MKKCEHAFGTCTGPSKACEAKLGLSEVKAEKAIFGLELLDFVKTADVWNLSDEEKVRLARKRKADGGTLFSAKRFELALEKYKKVVDTLASHDTFEQKELKTSAAE